jgi:hypothetical protein
MRISTWTTHPQLENASARAGITFPPQIEVKHFLDNSQQDQNGIRKEMSAVMVCALAECAV